MSDTDEDTKVSLVKEDKLSDTNVVPVKERKTSPIAVSQVNEGESSSSKSTDTQVQCVVMATALSIQPPSFVSDT